MEPYQKLTKRLGAVRCVGGGGCLSGQLLHEDDRAHLRCGCGLNEARLTMSGSSVWRKEREDLTDVSDCVLRRRLPVS